MSTVDSDLDVPGGATRPAPGDTEVTPARLARVGDLDVLFCSAASHWGRPC